MHSKHWTVSLIHVFCLLKSNLVTYGSPTQKPTAFACRQMRFPLNIHDASLALWPQIEISSIY